MTKKISKYLLASMSYTELQRLLMAMSKQDCNKERLKEVILFYNLKLRELFQ